nr:ribosomal protein S18-alanine N-acetyltransferase [Nodularia sp. LEGE 04288]
MPNFSSLLSPHSPFPINVTSLNLKLKTLTSEDLSAILELDQACFGGLWTMEGYQRELDSPNSELLGLFSPLAPSKLLGLGCFWAILDEAHITILAIHPQYHRQGLGQVLLYSLLKAACDRGLERSTLEVRASNVAAISLYEKFGFKIAGRRKGYYQDNGEDALVLWLSDLPETLDNWYITVSDGQSPPSGDRLRQSFWQIL